MRKLFIIPLAVVFAMTMTYFALAGSDCTTIQDGTLTASTGETLTTGYDEWGYNYEAHMFNGEYCDYTRGTSVPSGCPNNVWLMMKWNDAWLSNKDCNFDGKLDRHFGYSSYIGSGAWCTNHQSGRVDVNGKEKRWTYFVKIVAAPADAYEGGGYWYTADHIEIGPVIWGAFAIVQEVSNDPSRGEHGILYKSPAGPGVGSGHIQ